LTRRAIVDRIETKSGRTGQLTFVAIASTVTSDTGSDLLVERTNIVYLAPMPTATLSVPGKGEIEHLVWDAGRDVAITPPLLFRFSALTFNAHRIHYDRGYAASEGYPGLVVHAPLQAVLLAHLADTSYPQRRFRYFMYRAQAPAFDDAALRLRARSSDDGATVDLVAASREIVTMRATAATQPLSSLA
jgi:3-methylfumaryl-CoA hydratase